MIVDKIQTRFKANPATVGVQRIEQFTGPWAIHRDAFEAGLMMLSAADLRARVEEFVPTELTSDGYEIMGQTAVIELRGAMTKSGSSMSELGSTVRVRRAIRQADADPAVESIVLVIESPGGTAAGTKELAGAVRDTVKPTVAYIEDIGASAAYWVASQADRIAANATAYVGSIGTYMTVTDFSKAAENAGIVVHVIRAGEFKGAGTIGTEITQEQIDQWQTLVDETNAFFLEAVSSGRGLTAEAVAKVADGRVLLANGAMAAGLIDEISEFEEVLASMASTTQPEVRSTTMAENETKTGADLHELRARFPKATAEWIVEQLERGVTMEQAVSAWQLSLEAKLDEERARADEAEKKAKEAAAAAELPGGDGVKDSQAAGGEPLVANAREFRARVKQRGMELLAKNPSLRPMEAMLKAAQELRREKPEYLSIGE